MVAVAQPPDLMADGPYMQGVEELDWYRLAAQICHVADLDVAVAA
jgi:hypothetical protein